MKLPDLKFTAETVTFSSIFGISWKLFCENFLAIMIIVGIVYIPIDIVIFFLNDIEELKFKDYIKILGYLEQFIGIIATLAIALYLTAKIDNTNITLWDAMTQALKHWWKVVATNFITSIMIGFLLILLVVPWIIYGTYWAFITFIVLFLGLEGQKARDHSKKLVTTRWWKTFLILLSTFLFPFILGIVVSFCYYFLLGYYVVDLDTLPIAWTLIIDTVSNFGIDIIYSYFTVVTFVLFIAYQSVYGPTLEEKNENVIKTWI
jgi:hypothetical protein